MEIKIDNENYTLDVEKAKELGLFKKGYSKCKSCNDFVEKYKNKACFFSAFHAYQSIYSVNLEKSFKNHPIFMNFATSPMGCLEQLTEKDALAIFILAHLMRLRRDWVGNWEPNTEGDSYYAIFRDENNIIIGNFEHTGHFLTFPTKDMAHEFRECFCDIIEKCKMYI